MPKGISSHKFKIYSNYNSQTFYYHPDEATLVSKNILQHFLREMILQYCSESSFEWLDPYKTDGPILNDGIVRAALKPRGSICRDELGRRRNEYIKFEDRT
jgi:hypothetical protein